MKKATLIIIFAALAYFYFQEDNPASKLENRSPNSFVSKKVTTNESTQKIESIPLKENPRTIQRQPAQAVKIEKDSAQKYNGAPLRFVLQDGLAVVQGDLIVGALVDQNSADEDLSNKVVILPNVKLWPTSIIPFHIESNLPNPDRILQALALFEGSSIQFIPYTNQKDALVFTEGTENCKSYVGYTGGQQPLLLSPDCSASDIAHEILHALGFVHEQNRMDRDNYLDVIAENIDEKHLENFEKLPEEFMLVSGLAPFDFESLMIYPDWMFAKSGNATMKSKSGQPIIPSTGLSPIDLERLNRAYKGR